MFTIESRNTWKLFFLCQIMRLYASHEGICCFDQDGTTLSGDLEYVQSAIDACKNNNYVVAVVSASGIPQSSCGSKAICNAGVAASDWYYGIGSDKTATLTELQQRYGISKKSLVVLWDDTASYRTTVLANGFSVIGSAHGAGVRSEGVQCFLSGVASADFNECNQEDWSTQSVSVPSSNTGDIQGICCFDQDGTTLSGDLEYVQNAIDACKNNNYVVVVASASGIPQSSCGSQAICNAGVAASDWYYGIGSDKTATLTELQQRYGISQKSRVVLWDDTASYRATVLASGFSVIGSDHGAGVRSEGVQCFLSGVASADFDACNQNWSAQGAILPSSNVGDSQLYILLIAIVSLFICPIVYIIQKHYAIKDERRDGYTLQTGKISESYQPPVHSNQQFKV